MKLIDELEHCYTARSDPVKMAQNHWPHHPETVPRTETTHPQY